MLKPALFCIALIVFGTIVALNSKAPADVGPKLQAAVLPSAGDLPETQIVDYTFVFVPGEPEGGR